MTNNNTKDYESLYKNLVERIEEEFNYWRSKDFENHTTESEIRWSTYNKLRAFIYGIEHNI